MDAPFHFVSDGNTIEKVEIEVFVGDCYVTRFEGDLTSNDAAGILEKAKSVGASERILIAGKATVTSEAARVFAKSKIKLLGNK